MGAWPKCHLLYGGNGCFVLERHLALMGILQETGTTSLDELLLLNYSYT